MLSNDKLQFLRIIHNKTQQQIADWCDITTRYVGMIEHNEYNPSEEIVKAWCNCCYDIGKPIKRINSKGRSKKIGECNGKTK